MTHAEYQEFPLDVFCDHIYQESERLARQKARFEKKQLRVMMLRPRGTVLTVEEAKAVEDGASVPERYPTTKPNQLAVEESATFLQAIKDEKSAAKKKEKAKAKANQIATTKVTNQEKEYGNLSRNTADSRKKQALERRKKTT